MINFNKWEKLDEKFNGVVYWKLKYTSDYNYYKKVLDYLSCHINNINKNDFYIKTPVFNRIIKEDYFLIYSSHYDRFGWEELSDEHFIKGNFININDYI
jgi:hypothetical protein